jgi:hypothetical protein
MAILSKKIKDRKFLNLVQHGLKSKVLLPDGKINKMLVATPQGGVTSPLLSNIALSELDKFIARLKALIDKGKFRRISEGYSKLKTLRRSLRSKADSKVAFKALKAARKIGYGDPMDPGRIIYTRYAGNFLIGVIGPHKLAERVRALVQKFLSVRLKLRLDKEKTVITRSRQSKIPFVGYLIFHSPQKGFKTRRKVDGILRTIRQSRYGDIHLYVDTHRIIRKLYDKGFCDKEGSSKPNFQYLQDLQSFTISRISSILYGLNHYYKLANNRRRCINRIAFLLRQSSAKLFAAKFKLGTQKNNKFIG